MVRGAVESKTSLQWNIHLYPLPLLISQFNFGGGNLGFNNTKPLQNDYENLVKWDFAKVVGDDWRTGILWNISVSENSEVGPGDNGFFGFRAFPFPDANTLIVRSHNANQYIQHVIAYPTLLAELLQ